MRRKLVALRLGLFGLSFVAFGFSRVLGADDLERALKSLEEKLRSIHSLRFQFTQEISFYSMEEKEKVAGEASLKKPGNVRIVKSSPQEQITVSDGQKIWIHTPGLGQVWAGEAKDWSLTSEFSQSLIPWEGQVENLKKNFHLLLAPEEKENQDHVVLIARPKKEEWGYELRLFLSKETWLPVKTFYSSEAAQVETRFSGYQINPPFPKDLFRFKPPSGTEVISLN